jgi:hypothetical protein
VAKGEARQTYLVTRLKAFLHLRAVVPHVGQRGHYRFEKPYAEVDDFFTVEPGGMIHEMACFMD